MRAVNPSDPDEGPHPFPHVFRPLQLRGRTLRSRINLGAHTPNMGELGLVSDRHVGYYRERALGGAGMIVVEPVPVHRTAVLTRGNFRPDDDAVIPGFRRLVDTCREAAASTGDGDVVMIHQLYHVGQHGDADNSFAPNWSPSGLPSYHDADGSHAMTEAEIEEVLGGFVRAARRARAAGFDGVEIFAAYHALVDQFWTPWSNRRADGWGGSFEARMRFSSTLLASIRDACGDDFVIGLAVNLDPDAGPSLGVEEMQEIVAWHDERRLMDYVTCGTGSYFDVPKLIPTSFYPPRLGEPFAAALKKVVTHALVQAESHVRTPADAEAVIAAGHADMVSIVRGQIADPYLVAKARRGRADEVRPCISCNQLCIGRRFRDYWISCLVNPSVGHEWTWGGAEPSRAGTARDVVVVGGGPAGLEAARTAALRGHRVALHEAGAELGGRYRLAGMQPTRGQILDHLEWYERELRRLGVEVRTASTVAPADLERLAAGGTLVLATGAVPPRRGFQRALPLVDRLPGVDGGNVCAVDDVLRGTVAPTGAVLVIDDLGGWPGLGTALALQEAGARTTLVTSAPVAAGALAFAYADVPLRGRYLRAGGTVRTGTVVTGWHGDAAELVDATTGVATTEPFDWLVVAETAEPATALAEHARALGLGVLAVGDCVAPRRAATAFYEGRTVAMSL